MPNINHSETSELFSTDVLPFLLQLMTDKSCADIQKELLEKVSADNCIYVHLSEETNRDTIPSELLYPNSILCDFTGGRSEFINKHKEIQLTAPATRAWIEHRPSQNTFYGLGKFHMYDREHGIKDMNITEKMSINRVRERASTMTQINNDTIDDKPKVMWDHYDLEISNKLPATVVDLNGKKYIHLLCGSGLFKTDFIISQTLIAGVTTFLAFMTNYIIDGDDKKKLITALFNVPLLQLMSLHIPSTSTDSSLILDTTDPEKYRDAMHHKELVEIRNGIKGYVVEIIKSDSIRKPSTIKLSMSPAHHQDKDIDIIAMGEDEDVEDVE